MNNIFKLVKYDLIKTKNILLAVLMGVFVLEASFIIGKIAHLNLLFGIASTVLLLALAASGIALLIYSINIFNTDFSKKQGYMPFLTPTSPYAIVASKIITTLIISAIGLIIIICFFSLDVSLVTKDAKEEFSVPFLFKTLIDLFDGKWGSVILLIVNMIVEICNNIIVIYLAITLANSLLTESKLRGLTAFGMWVAINIIMAVLAKIMSVITDSSVFTTSINRTAQTYDDLINLSFSNNLIILSIIVNSIVFIGMYTLTGWIADKKLSM